MSEYGPQPAFNAGWLKTALPEAVKPMTELMAGLRQTNVADGAGG